MPLFDFNNYAASADSPALRIGFADAEPVLSATNLNHHYTTLYAKYIEQAEENPKDEFFVSGEVLHKLFFEQMRPADSMISPDGAAKEFIDHYFTNFLSFKQAFITKSMSIRGSGWCYLDKRGTIEIIRNHEHVEDVVFIVDMWEHSYYTDYGPDKESYLNNIWKIIDWSIISARLT